jgi:hypothetical protein
MDIAAVPNMTWKLFFFFFNARAITEKERLWFVLTRQSQNESANKTGANWRAVVAFPFWPPPSLPC